MGTYITLVTRGGLGNRPTFQLTAQFPGNRHPDVQTKSLWSPLLLSPEQTKALVSKSLANLLLLLTNTMSLWEVDI